MISMWASVRAAGNHLSRLYPTWELNGHKKTHIANAEGRTKHAKGRPLRWDAAEVGTAKLIDQLAVLADCPKARSFSIYDRCKARYARYYGP
jgi:hypothetical protein